MNKGSLLSQITGSQNITREVLGPITESRRLREENEGTEEGRGGAVVVTGFTEDPKIVTSNIFLT